jgi:hypothetical protein
MIPPGKHMITEVLATVDDEFLRELKKSQFPSSLLRVIRLWPSDSPSQTLPDQAPAGAFAGHLTTEDHPGQSLHSHTPRRDFHILIDLQGVW